MARTTLPEAVEVLRFFETGPIETAEAVLNIVTEKMKERRQREGIDPVQSTRGRGGRRKRTDEALPIKQPEGGV